MNRIETLNEAISIVTGHREKEYGSPEDSFDLIARYWSAHLNCRITATDVAAMMALLKLARLSGDSSKADSWIDLAGYAACGCEIATRDKLDYDVEAEKAHAMERAERQTSLQALCDDLESRRKNA